MNKFFIFILTGLIASSALAQRDFGRRPGRPGPGGPGGGFDRPDHGRPGFGRPGRPGMGGPRERRNWNRDGRGFVDFNGKKYVYFNQEVCGTDIRVKVYGDSVMIADIDLILDNGISRDVSRHPQRLQENQSTDWVNLGYMTCIDGFSVDARSEADFDKDDAYIQLIVWDGRNENYTDEIIRIKDFNVHRGMRGGQRWDGRGPGGGGRPGDHGGGGGRPPRPATVVNPPGDALYSPDQLTAQGICVLNGFREQVGYTQSKVAGNKIDGKNSVDGRAAFYPHRWFGGNALTTVSCR